MRMIFWLSLVSMVCGTAIANALLLTGHRDVGMNALLVGAIPSSIYVIAFIFHKKT